MKSPYLIYHKAKSLIAWICIIVVLTLLPFTFGHSNFVLINYSIIIILWTMDYFLFPLQCGLKKLAIKYKTETPFLPAYFPHELKIKKANSIIIDSFSFANMVRMVIRKDGIVFIMKPPLSFLRAPFLIHWNDILQIIQTTPEPYYYGPINFLFRKRKPKRIYIKLEIKDCPDVELLMSEELYKESDIENYLKKPLISEH